MESFALIFTSNSVENRLKFVVDRNSEVKTVRWDLAESSSGPRKRKLDDHCIIVFDFAVYVIELNFTKMLYY